MSKSKKLDTEKSLHKQYIDQGWMKVGEGWKQVEEPDSEKRNKRDHSKIVEQARKKAEYHNLKKAELESQRPAFLQDKESNVDTIYNKMIENGKKSSRHFIPKVRTYELVSTEIPERKPIPEISLEDFEELVTNEDFIDNYYIEFRRLLEYKACDYDRMKNIRFKSLLVSMYNKPKSWIRKRLFYIINGEFGLKSIIGRDHIKNIIIRKIYAFSNNYSSCVRSFNNIIITGNPGSGKTFLAAIISKIFSKAGFILTDNIKIATRTDLVGKYVGQTGPMTRDLLNNTLEGVLFIDEAYQLARPSKSSNVDYGHESITELVNFIDKNMGKSIIIAAGYKKEMEEYFLPANDGIDRRFSIRINLNMYSPEELSDIAINSLSKMINYDVGCNEANFIYSLIVKYSNENANNFKNGAGDMLNLSSYVAEQINLGYYYQWKPNDIKNNSIIIVKGFDEFFRRE